jgi:hypothetical protein
MQDDASAASRFGFAALFVSDQPDAPLCVARA